MSLATIWARSAPAPPFRTVRPIADAARVLEKYKIRASAAIRTLLHANHETPKPGDPIFNRVQNAIIGSNRQAIDAAAARLANWAIVRWCFRHSLKARPAISHRCMPQSSRRSWSTGRPMRPPVCILSGGETTVTVRGKGLGGRNQEFVLAAALALDDSNQATR